MQLDNNFKESHQQLQSGIQQAEEKGTGEINICHPELLGTERGKAVTVETVNTPPIYIVDTQQPKTA